MLCTLHSLATMVCKKWVVAHESFIEVGVQK